MYFVIPASEHHGCDYAHQDGLEHRAKTIVLQSNCSVIVDLVFEPSLFFTAAEMSFGCEGALLEKPYAIEYLNRFIEIGKGKNVIPGQGNRHVIDKYHYYHVKDDPKHFSVGSSYALAFKLKIGSPGTYIPRIFFFGDEVEGEIADLLIVVEDSPKTLMRCVLREHRRRKCTKSIQPR